MSLVKILDTNIILLDAYNIVTLGQDGGVIIIPETVVDEIDSKKSGHSEVAFQAREFSRLLSKANLVFKGQKGPKYITQYELDGASIAIIALQYYPAFEEAEPNIVRDRRIIYAATLYKEQPHEFISNDVMCRIRAQTEGLTVKDLKIVDNINFPFTKTLTVSTEVFVDLHRSPVGEIDKTYTQTNYNYIILDSVTGQSKLATVENGLLTVLGKETEKELRKQDLNPMNVGQLFLSKAIQDPSVSIVVCEAASGSGKTATAISNAIRLVRGGKHENILYIRASVDDLDKSEEIGFLSGNDEKMSVYLHPLEDTLDFIIRNRYKASPLKGAEFELKVQEEIERLRARCNIQAMIGLGMRGRTFRNSVVIIDEAQNQSKASLQKMLTRFTDDCKIIIIGSNRQIDNPYLTKYTNGLSTLLDACTKPQQNIKLHAVTLPKVVRGKIAEFAENLFGKEVR